MSPILKAGLIYGLASVAAFFVLLFVPIPLLNLVLAYVALIVLGWFAGRSAAQNSGALAGQGSGRGAAAGAIAGAINLVVMAISFAALLSVITRVPGVREQMQAGLDQARTNNPGQQVPSSTDLTGMLGAAGAVAGVCLGLVSLIFMTVAGLVGGATYKGSPTGTAGTAGAPYTIGPLPGAYAPPATPAPPATSATVPLDSAPGMTPGDQTPPRDLA